MNEIGDLGGTTLWHGRRHTLAAAVANGRLPTTRYRLTDTHLYWTHGRIGTRVADVPLWAVRDATLSQSVAQRARRVGTITVSLQHRDYVGTPTFVLIEDVEKPSQVVATLNTAARRARSVHDTAR